MVLSVVMLAMLAAVMSAQMGIAGAVPAPYADRCLVGEPMLYNKTAADEVPWYEVNLDLPPIERWKQIGTDYKEKILDLLVVVKNITLPFFHGQIVQWVDQYIGRWDERLPQPYQDELKVGHKYHRA